MKIIGIGIIAFLLFQLQRMIYAKYWDKNLSVKVFFAQSVITEGDTGEVVEIIENRKRLPLSLLKVKFQTSKHLEFADTPEFRNMDQYYRHDLFQVGGGERITRKLIYTGAKRGYYHIRNIDLVGADLLLSTEMSKSMSTSSYLYVYPRLFANEDFLQSLQKLSGEVLTKRHLLEDPFEYRGIREYQPYDDMRSVNWKATARTGTLMVNQRNYTALQTLRIFMNLEDTGIQKHSEAVEACMQIAMGLSAHFLAAGIKVACYGNGIDILNGDAVSVAGGAGAGQLDAISKALARIDTEKPTLSFADLYEEMLLQNAKNTINVFVSPNGYEDFIAVLKKCDEAGMDYRWFYPHTFEPPEVPEELRNRVEFLRIERS